MLNLTETAVLWATMSDATPLGSIINRLERKYTIDRSLLLKILAHLIERKLVVQHNKDRDILYRKISYAMEQLVEILENETE